MLKFRKFKASLDLATGKGNGTEYFDKSPGIFINGAYRTNRDEIFSPVLTYSDPPRKHNVLSPSMVKLPNLQSQSPVKAAKSVNDLTTTNVPTNLHKSTSDIPQTVNSITGVQLTKNQIKEQKKIEKQRLADEKKREKAAVREQQKQEKLIKERDKKTQQTKLAEEKRNTKKRSTPKTQNEEQPQNVRQPQTVPPRSIPQNNAQPQIAPPRSRPQNKEKPQIAPPRSRPKNEGQHQNPPLQTESKNEGQPQIVPPRTKSKSRTKSVPKPVQTSSQGQASMAYPTNTLESSISRSSGPPPYSAVPEIIQNQSDKTGNTSFTKPSEEGSWDLISQHRQQINRQTGVGKGATKQKHLDLHYNVDKSKSSNNSEV